MLLNRGDELARSRRRALHQGQDVKEIASDLKCREHGAEGAEVGRDLIEYFLWCQGPGGGVRPKLGRWATDIDGLLAGELLPKSAS